jgi:sterol 24-C-methyltransferase
MTEPDHIRPRLADLGRTALPRDEVQSAFTTFDELSRDVGDTGLVARREAYARVSSNFYDLVTDFYEYGWGEAFHFAPRFRNETHFESLRRHEHYLALMLQLKRGERVIDVGCGVGGPMRMISRFADVDITALNINLYQVKRTHVLTRAAGLQKSCRVIKADFHHMPFPDGSIDKAYAIEATVHSPDLVKVYSEINRVLKPGGLFATYEWCMTDRYRPENPAHRAVKDQLVIGNGVPDMGSSREVMEALKKSGFEILWHEDRALTGEIPWYEPLAPQKLTLRSFRASPPGRRLTNAVLTVLEGLRFVPRGTTAVARMLHDAATNLTESGKQGLFTPAYLVVCRKP